jgi:hypothetical protein
MTATRTWFAKASNPPSACRTPENIVIDLPDIEDSLVVGYRRT